MAITIDEVRKMYRNLGKPPHLSDDLKFHIDGFAEFDPRNGNSLVLSAQCKENNCTGSINP